MSSASTSSLSSRPGPVERGDRGLLLAEPLLELGQGAVLELGGPAVVGLPLGLLDLRLERSRARTWSLGWR